MRRGLAQELRAPTGLKEDLPLGTKMLYKDAAVAMTPSGKHSRVEAEKLTPAAGSHSMPDVSGLASVSTLQLLSDLRDYLTVVPFGLLWGP